MAAPGRRLDDWVTGFLEYTEILSSPRIFRLWAAIGTVSAALERRVHVRTMGADLFPNLYVVLVGPPGVGKSVVLAHSERLIRSVPDLFVAPSNVSSASLIDSLGEAKRKVLEPKSGWYSEFNYLVAVASELGTFLPVYEASFMNLLTKAYDGEMLEDRKRTKNISVKIDRPLLSILGGTTPSYLNSFLPEGAWDQGFTSRTIFIFSGDRHIVSPFTDEAQHERLDKLYSNLLLDLKSIGQLVGRINFEPSATSRIVDWHMQGGPPAPDHSKLLHYLPRRTTHLLKLCLVSAASRGASTILERDFESGLAWLLEAEVHMPEIFKAMGSSGDASVMEDTWYYVYAQFVKDKRLVPERRLIEFISKKVPNYSVLHILELMVKSGMLQPSIEDQITVYKPLPRQR